MSDQAQAQEDKERAAELAESKKFKQGICKPTANARQLEAAEKRNKDVKKYQAEQAKKSAAEAKEANAALDAAIDD